MNITYTVTTHAYRKTALTYHNKGRMGRRCYLTSSSTSGLLMTVWLYALKLVFIFWSLWRAAVCPVCCLGTQFQEQIFQCYDFQHWALCEIQEECHKWCNWFQSCKVCPHKTAVSSVTVISFTISHWRRKAGKSSRWHNCYDTYSTILVRKGGVNYVKFFRLLDLNRKLGLHDFKYVQHR